MSSSPNSNVISRQKDWWRSAIVYQIYPRSFQDSNGDGIGDIPGITARLDYLADLGVDVIWLSPVYRSPQVDNGYDISDYRDIDPIFGCLDDIDTLIVKAHELGIKIMMDLVVNHTSNKHEWFIASRNPKSDKRDWYYWRDAKPGCTPGAPGAEPDASPAVFSPSAWTFDETSGQYYLGAFSPGQPDLNWENQDVRQAVYEMMRWWVARGVDGFRMDVINMISKPESLTSGEPLAPEGITERDIVNGPRLDEFLAEMNREVGLEREHLMTVGETPGATTEVAKRITGSDRHELNMVFTFEHVSLDQADRGTEWEQGTKWNLAKLHLPDLKKNLAAWQDGLADVGWNSLYWNNHDQPRVVSRFGDDSDEHRVNSAKTLATVLHMHKGTPFIYQGEEIGMTNVPFASIEDYRDVESLNYYRLALAAGKPEAEILTSLAVKSRDHARTPMQWEESANAGFTNGEPWFKPNPNYPKINAKAARQDPNSVFKHYQALIKLRHESEVVREGRFELLLAEHEQIWAFTRTLGDETLLVLANCSSKRAAIPNDLPDLNGGELILGTHADNAPDFLAPWESRILSFKKA